MIIPDKKKAVTIILGRHRDGGVQDHAAFKPEHEINDNDAMLKSIAEDMMRAMENKSAHELMMAMRAFWSQIQEADEAQDQEMR